MLDSFSELSRVKGDKLQSVCMALNRGALEAPSNHTVDIAFCLTGYNCYARTALDGCACLFV